MNSDIKRQWVAALRSGKYAQSSGDLRQVCDGWLPDRFSALGVLCELAVEAGVIDREYVPELHAYRYGGVWFYLPEAVQQWAGLGNGYPQVVGVKPETWHRYYGRYPVESPERGEWVSVHHMSKYWGISFRELSTIIEENEVV